MIRRAPKEQVPIHGPEGFQSMRVAGRLAAETLDFITPHVVPGVTTQELDRLCEEFIKERGGICAPMGYRGYPKNICTSVNHVVCHGIPSEKKLRKGDIVNIDVTPIVDGWHGDTSRMFYVGPPNVKCKKLVQATYDALMKAIELVEPGCTLGDIGHAIQSHVEPMRYSVVRDFCGHGVGKNFHEPPNVMHFGHPGEGTVLEAGMIFTIEPMVNAGKAETKILSDGWTAVTRDKSLSAQFEHTIGVTEDGVEIFTLSPKGWHCPPYEGK